MKRQIEGFEVDEQGDWRAALECGHFQHVRHNPPLTTRSWVLTEAGRASRIGLELNCKRCDDEAEKENSSINQLDGSAHSLAMKHFPRAMDG